METTSLTTLRSNHWQGALWKILACACFAAINGIVRYVAGGSPIEIAEPLPVQVIAFWQNVFGALFMLPWLARNGLIALQTSRPGLHAFRVITAVLGVVLFYLALKNIPIAQAVALSFTGPMFTILGAKLFLHETIGRRRALAIACSFCGAYVISRPELAIFGASNYLGLAALLPMASAIAISCAKLSTRRLASAKESPEAMTTYLLLLMAPVSLIWALFYWQVPNVEQMFWLVALGMFAAGAHYATSKAYALAEVTFLSPFGFSKFLLSVSVGYLAFLELPNGWDIWLGIAIISSSFIILLGNRPKIVRDQASATN